MSEGYINDGLAWGYICDHCGAETEQWDRDWIETGVPTSDKPWDGVVANFCAECATAWELIKEADYFAGVEVSEDTVFEDVRAWDRKLTDDEIESLYRWRKIGERGEKPDP